jgi:hypothetical protein
MIPSLNIMRPSLLLGDRKESRFGEKIAQVVMPAFSWALGGSSAKYKAIDAGDVAKAMLAAANASTKGIHFYDYTQMKELISG